MLQNAASNKYMERLLLGEIENLRRKGKLIKEAVEDYVQRVEDEIRKGISYNLQNQYTELQKILMNSGQTLDGLIIGLSTMVPSPGGHTFLPSLGDVPRQNLISGTGSMTEWSSRDCTASRRTSSPDIVETQIQTPSERRSSSSSSTTSSNRPPPKARTPNAVKKKQPLRSTVIDEFSMEIPDSATMLNVDAPEFRPNGHGAPGESIPVNSAGDSDGKIPRERNSVSPEPEGNNANESGVSEASDNHHGSSESSQSTFSVSSSSSAPQILTSASSVESFLTPPGTGSELRRNGVDHGAGRTTTSRSGDSSASFYLSPDGTGLCSNDDKHAMKDYPRDAESRPSSHHAKSLIYDTDQVLRGTAQVLREQEALNSREQALKDEPNHDGPIDWKERQAWDSKPNDVRKTRIPPTWTYTHVNFSHVDAESGRIYVQLLADEITITSLSEEANSDPSRRSRPLELAEIETDLVVIAPFENLYYRASVVSKKSENDIEVFFIDYGNTAKVKAQDLSLINTKLQYKTCRLAIPCVLDASLACADLIERLPETAYVCLANPPETEQGSVYRIMDVMHSSKENFLELPETIPFSAPDDPKVFSYSVVITNAINPDHMWVVETKDVDVPEKVTAILHGLPPEPCSPTLALKSTYVAHKGRRAMVIECHDGLFDLLQLDDGVSVLGVPITACRRLPLMTHLIPQAAKLVKLANCQLRRQDKFAELIMSNSAGKKYNMKVKNDDSDDVILVDPVSEKYLAKELKRLDCDL
ncbi:uncharacterized protein LOC100903495 [Galendromus occidentalis]|uniref:Uncharacterized protein LOC100903495 n=1 Tax=Galendromus occidentalis TaxID=34638 RepID=A0AAJ7L2D0_9ACAR|nr:uncharacterized protein LOC100903495 [Galendromus occidentalis]